MIEPTLKALAVPHTARVPRVLCKAGCAGCELSQAAVRAPV